MGIGMISSEPASLRFFTLAGRRLPISDLNESERRLLDKVATKYVPKRDWTRFAAWWNAEFSASGLPMSSVVYRICQDLEARLGIRQGKVAPPDYRDFLAELIDEKFGSRQEFCKQANIDAGQLSRVLANRADLSLKVLQQALDLLGAKLVVQTGEDVASRSGVEGAAEMIAAMVASGSEHFDSRGSGRVLPALAVPSGETAFST